MDYEPYNTRSERQTILDEKIPQGYIVIGNHIDIKKQNFLMLITPNEASAWMKRNAIKQLNKVDRFQMKILISLIDALISKGVITANDLTPAEKAMYQKIKQLWIDAEK